MPANPDYSELLERLTRKVHHGLYAHGGGSIGTDGSGKVTGTSWGGGKIMELANPDGPEAATAITVLLKQIEEKDAALLDDINVMMSEFVEIAKTMRAAIEQPKHKFWGAGEPDCPADIIAGNGELHTLRCKVCGSESTHSICRPALSSAILQKGTNNAG